MSSMAVISSTRTPESSLFTTISSITESIIATGHSSGPTDVTHSTPSDAVNTNPSPNVENQLSVVYAASEGLVSLLAIFGNALVVYVFCTNRSLRRYRNYYIFALAIADFLVGLFGIPLAVLANMGLPRNLFGCLFTVSILMVLCTISILCLVAVSIDRYWATTNPFAYYRHMTTSTSVGIILSCWIVGGVIGFLPLFGWYNLEGYLETGGFCLFRSVMDYNYLVFLYFATIVFPAVLMGCFYGYIYRVVLIKIRQKGNLVPQLRRPSEQSRSGSLNSDNRGATQMQRIIVSEKRREAKAAHKLGIIVLFFLLCWMPCMTLIFIMQCVWALNLSAVFFSVYTFNCIQAFCPNCRFPDELWNFLVILSHANSSLNPLLYAYHLKEFRGAMKHALIQLFEKLCCGLLANRLQKDGALSRSQTLPTLAQGAAMGNASGKFSIQFRRSPLNNDLHRSAHISPRQVLQSSTSSNLHHNTITDKSLTSLSLASDISSSILQETHHRQPSPSSDVETSRPRFLDQMRCSSLTENGDSRYNINHGIEIHVQNVEAEKGESETSESEKLGDEVQQQEKAVSQKSTAEQLAEETAQRQAAVVDKELDLNHKEIPVVVASTDPPT